MPPCCSSRPSRKAAMNEGRAEGWYYTDANSKPDSKGYSSKGTILLTRK